VTRSVARDVVTRRLSQMDPALGRVIAAVSARIGPQRIVPSRTTAFEALTRAIIYQSIAGKAAAAIFARLKETMKPLSPRKVAAVCPSSLARIGVSRTKAETLHALAIWFLSNRRLADALPTLADEKIVETLTAIPGIGAWTANVFLIFNLGRPDVLPAGDLGIRRAITLAYSLPGRATPMEVIKRSQAWRPYRSLASIYLWQFMRLKLTADDLQPRRRQ
jgi:DNA-3-methyladenine glycosylase II